MEEKKYDIPRNITYCTNKNCSRDCERNIGKHDFKNNVILMSNYDCEENFEEEYCIYYIPIKNKNSYSTWKCFEFRPPTYVDGHFNPDIYDLVKWEEHEPYEVVDGKTGKKKMSTRSCFSIGRLVWNEKEPCFEFESCGLRYLEYRVDGLEEFILDFAEKTYKERIKDRW